MRRLVILIALIVAGIAPPALAADPIVGVWYRGTPAGTPNQSELAVIRALGFNGVTWPESQTQGIDSLRKMAGAVGLSVTIAGQPAPVTPASLLMPALAPAERCDLAVTSQNAESLTALAWRAVAHGARTLAFDSGASEGAGLENADRSLKTWVRLALDVARQVTLNPRLVNAFRPGPGVIVTPESSPNLDVVMLDAGRSWALIATNASASPVTATVRLPSGTPYAIWLDLLDATTLAMNGEAAGPRWNLTMAPHSARVYIIDKVMK